ncbi:p100-1R [African swine fever virus]|uniref:MGF 100-1R n=1 Tax=African swine fever virus TaxID=10497 RepID=A0A0C5AWI8_ASF|nr:MGF 100-1R [African swine fever virus]UYB79162.1 pMGF100-1R [Recombinant African swine fever virus]AJL34184.1 MGF 100-1R [African swine fever virus]AXB49234.1 p100-1R [African swine fever virus]AXB49408.1 p100-1R [African swine fever virus]AXB49581.1 p100-1R [African swine fever virus]
MVKLFYNPIKCLFYRRSCKKKLRKALKKLNFYHPPKECCQIYRLLENAPGGTYFITENMTNELIMIAKDPVDKKIKSVKLYLTGNYIKINQHYYINIYMYLMRYNQIYKYPLICFSKYSKIL